MAEIRVAGFGGQGIMRSGYIIGKAAAIYDKKEASLIQSYGPEARGGACSSQVVVHEGAINYPFVDHPDVLIVMSQEAYNKFAPTLRQGGMLLSDADLVKAEEGKVSNLYSIPATRLAEELHMRIVANMVMLGFFTGITQVVSVEAMKRTIPESVPSRFVELNLQAFDRGYGYAQKVKSG